MAPDHPLIRDATEADIRAIAAIYGDEVENGVASFEEVVPSEQEMTTRMAKIVGLGLPYLAAEDSNGRFLGYSYAGPFHARAAYRFTVEDSIYIDPSARGQGVGKALLRELIDRCGKAGCRQMMALITYTDDSPSIALHMKMGFRSIGVAQAVGYKHGRWLDVAYMQRAIGPGQTIPPDRAAAGQSIAG
ncbi:MAG TPA: GNAT family N-acetyltransferase [Alphaproteobacteria bacterium]|nr:GNAT family N-acetyltransferase [Alphaproteobacteria bacterium]